jgi:hypothetical protein
MSKRSASSALVAILFAIAAAFGFEDVTSAQDAIHPGSKVHSSDRSPVDVELVNQDQDVLHVRIPRSYLVRRSQWRGGRQDLVNLEARLPQMNAAPAIVAVTAGEGSEEYRRQRLQLANGVAITLFASRGDSQLARTSWHELREHEQVGFHSNVYRRVEDDVPGLERYREFLCSEKRSEPCRPFGRDHLVNTDRDAPFVLIICDTNLVKDVGYRAGCRAHSSFRRHQLGYTLRYDQLNRWKEFDSGVRRLLESFVVAGPQDRPAP